MLTRDKFASWPRPVFDAVQQDAIADTVAWMVTVARSGDSEALPWESHLWEEQYYTPGQGDGVVEMLPLVITVDGLVPLDQLLVARAGIVEVDFLLFGGGLHLADEPLPSRERPKLTARELLAVMPSRPGTAVGAMRVDMFGGFEYSTVAAGIGAPSPQRGG